MIRALVLGGVLLAGPVLAGPGLAQTLAEPAPDAAQAQDEVQHGTGAVLRGLDKISGQTTDFEIGRGGFAEFGRLEIEMRDCRYPAGNPAGDAYAWVTIRAEGGVAPVFEGWMIASSPALNALDHPRYDVWVIRCKT